MTIESLRLLHKQAYDNYKLQLVREAILYLKILLLPVFGGTVGLVLLVINLTNTLLIRKVNIDRWFNDNEDLSERKHWSEYQTLEMLTLNLRAKLLENEKLLEVRGNVFIWSAYALVILKIFGG